MSRAGCRKPKKRRHKPLVINPDGGTASLRWHMTQGKKYIPCCNKERRDMNGWCTSCGDPCI